MAQIEHNGMQRFFPLFDLNAEAIERCFGLENGSVKHLWSDSGEEFFFDEGTAMLRKNVVYKLRMRNADDQITMGVQSEISRNHSPVVVESRTASPLTANNLLSHGPRSVFLIRMLMINGRRYSTVMLNIAGTAFSKIKDRQSLQAALQEFQGLSRDLFLEANRAVMNIGNSLTIAVEACTNFLEIKSHAAEFSAKSMQLVDNCISSTRTVFQLFESATNFSEELQHAIKTHYQEENGRLAAESRRRDSEKQSLQRLLQEKRKEIADYTAWQQNRKSNVAERRELSAKIDRNATEIARKKRELVGFDERLHSITLGEQVRQKNLAEQQRIAREKKSSSLVGFFNRK